KERIDELARTVRLRKEGYVQEAVSVVETGRGERLMKELRGRISGMKADEDSLRTQLKANLRAALARTSITFALGTALAVFVLIYALLQDQRSGVELRTRERWLSTILRSLGEGVIATDSERRVTLMNSKAQELTGWTWAEARGRPLQEVYE